MGIRNKIALYRIYCDQHLYSAVVVGEVVAFCGAFFLLVAPIIPGVSTMGSSDAKQQALFVAYLALQNLSCFVKGGLLLVAIGLALELVRRRLSHD